MSVTGGLEAVIGVLLLFFLPGYALTKATFPEWRLRGARAVSRLVVILSLSFVLSEGLTILVGYVLLAAGPGGFRASWSDPVLEVVLGGVTVVAVAIGGVRGAFRREPPVRTAPEPLAGDEGAFELTVRLDRLQREERRLEHALRRSGKVPAEDAKLRLRLEEIRRARAALVEARESEYAS